jgi:hypothetical protein
MTGLRRAARWASGGVGRLAAAGLLALASIGARALHHWEP